MPTFECDAPVLQAKYESAVAGLRANTKLTNTYPYPVLWEGGVYGGIWLECGPHESLVFMDHEPETARHSHEIFMHYQHADGYLPCHVRSNTKVGTGQVQTVVPFAFTGLQVATRLRDEAMLRRIYEASGRYDQWLSRYRNTRGTGCCELFCEWDSGHDGSPRFKGLPHACPEDDARVCPQLPGLPFLAPDLTAAQYGGRVALAKIADLLDRPHEARHWRELAEQQRQAMFAHVFDEEDACFFDRKSDGSFLRIRSEVLLCVLREHIVDRKLFDRIYERHLHNPQRFWTPYPFPSVAVDDAEFDKAIPPNSWGSASQALSALRCPLWMEHYGRFSDLVYLMQRWLEAIGRAKDFMQQMNPWTGEFCHSEGYSPAMLCVVDFVRRLYGIRLDEEGDLEWNCRVPEGATHCRYQTFVGGFEAEVQSARGVSRLLVNGREVVRIRGVGRLVTRTNGLVLRIINTEAEPARISVQVPGQAEFSRVFDPDEVHTLIMSA